MAETYSSTETPCKRRALSAPPWRSADTGGALHRQAERAGEPSVTPGPAG